MVEYSKDLLIETIQHLNSIAGLVFSLTINRDNGFLYSYNATDENDTLSIGQIINHLKGIIATYFRTYEYQKEKK